jgi:hypothetical protein
MIKQLLLFALALSVVVAMAVAMKELPQQPSSDVDHAKYLKFSHTFHVKEQGIACEDCHTNAKASKVSSDNLLGNHQSCQSCHEEQINSTCQFCHTEPENIVPLPKSEQELLFSHELHTSTLNLECASCHAGIDTVAYVTEANMPAMSSCIECHQAKKFSTNCELCHTNFTSLMPADHRVTDFQRTHKELARVGIMDVSCATCHTESFCQDCHTGTELLRFGFGRDLWAEPSPRTSTKDSPKQLRLQQVHSLNYRFTHSIEAKSKLSDCSTCHERQSFCVECHQTGGNINQVKFKPESHNVGGFTTIGRGSGGGKHAELAKRDIESCASCHDVQGYDPTCMICHTENGDVR